MIGIWLNKALVEIIRAEQGIEVLAIEYARYRDRGCLIFRQSDDMSPGRSEEDLMNQIRGFIKVLPHEICFMFTENRGKLKLLWMEDTTLRKFIADNYERNEIMEEEFDLILLREIGTSLELFRSRGEMSTMTDNHGAQLIPAFDSPGVMVKTTENI